MNKRATKNSRPLYMKLGLKHRRHTGRALHHRNTSYGILFFVLLLFLPHIAITRGVKGTVTSSGNVQVTALVPGPAPTVPATINSPASGSSVQNPTITVSGTCSANLLVKVFRNDIFAGATYCSSSGTFSIDITLFTGRNDIRALNYDALDQAGPASPTVTITYTPPASVAAKTPNKTANLLFEADYHLRQINPNIRATWQLSIKGGAAPYSVNTAWGDGSTDKISVPQDGVFELKHSYTTAGYYLIVIQVTDTFGASTRLQLAVTVNGSKKSPVTTATKKTTPETRCSQSNWFGRSLCVMSRLISDNVIPLYWLLLLGVGCAWGITRIRRRRKGLTAAGAH